MPTNPNDVRSAAFRAANGLPPIRAKFPTPKKPPALQNPFTDPRFKAANAPDQGTPARAAPKPAGPALGPAYGGYTLPAVNNAVNFANQVASGGGGGGSPSLGSAGSTASLLKQAQQMVGYELDPQIHAAQAAYNQENRDYGFLINNLNKQTGVAKGDITALFQALDQQLAAGSQAQKAAYDTAKTGVNSAYDQLAAMLNTGYDTAQNAANAEQARLGIAGPGQNDRLAADKAFLTGLAGEQKANAVSNITTQGANAQSIAGSMRSSAQEASPHLVAQITMAANEQQQQLLKQHIDNLAKYKNQVGLLNEQRGGKVQMVLKQLQDQLYQRQQDAAQLQFLNGIKAAELGISAGQLQLAQARLAQDGAIATNNAALAAKRLDFEMSKPGAGTTQTGMERAFSYLGSAYPDQSRQNDLQNALIDAINGNSTDPGFNQDQKTPGLPGYGIPGYNVNYLGTYLAAIDSAVADRTNIGWGPIERSVLRNAVLKFFGK